MTLHELQQDFKEFYSKNKGLVLSVAFSLTSDPDLVQDLAQEAWSKLWSVWDTYQHQDGVSRSTWVHKVAYNACVDYLRTHYERQPESFLDSEIEVSSEDDDSDDTNYVDASWIEENIESPYFSPEEDFVLQTFFHKIASLSEQEAAVFNLWYWHGLSYSAISRKLNISEEYARVVASRSRAKLEGELTRVSNKVHLYKKPQAVWADWSWKEENNNKLWQRDKSQALSAR